MTRIVEQCKESWVRRINMRTSRLTRGIKVSRDDYQARAFQPLLALGKDVFERLSLKPQQFLDPFLGQIQEFVHLCA